MWRQTEDKILQVAPWARRVDDLPQRLLNLADTLGVERPTYG